jgi:hypothetical protein
VQQFLAMKNITVIAQPLYSPDLAPSDIWLFPTMKTDLQGACFTAMEHTELNVMTELQKISKETCWCLQQ